jgi:hypothetical protein
MSVSGTASYDHIIVFGSNGVSIGMTNASNVDPAFVAAPNHLLELGSNDAYKPGTSTWTNPSDRRVKNDIALADLDRCYEIVKELPLQRFTWNDDQRGIRDRRKVGWIAQEVEAVFPKAVTTVPLYNGIVDFKTLDVDQIYAVLYGCVQKLQQTVESLTCEMCAIAHGRYLR